MIILNKLTLIIVFLLILVGVLIYQLYELFRKCAFYNDSCKVLSQQLLKTQDDYRKLEVRYLNIKDDYERVCIQLKQKS